MIFFESNKKGFLRGIKTNVIVTVLLVALLTGMVTPLTGLTSSEVYAADGDNLSFQLRAYTTKVEGKDTIVYGLDNINVAEGSYKSIMVSFPSTLEILPPDTTNYSPVWNLTSSTGSAISTYSYVVGSSTDKNVVTTAAKVNEFLSALTFRTATPPDGKAGIKVSISRNTMSSYVDKDEKEHFYEVVSSSTKTSWLVAYNEAKKKEYRGMEGYLATITSQEEQNMIYRTITKNTAWLGGTRMLVGTGANTHRINGHTTDKELNTTFNTISNYTIDKNFANKWYWVDGPEQGQEFYDSASCLDHYKQNIPKTNPLYHGEYGFFGANNTDKHVYDDGTGTWGEDPESTSLKPAGSVTGDVNKVVYRGNDTVGQYQGYSTEPNNSNGSEYCLQFAYQERPSWNDFPYDGAVNDYIVEYGGYDPADEGNGKHPLPEVNEHEELPPVPVTVNYASRLSPDSPLTDLKTIELYGTKVGDQFVAEPQDIPGYTFVGFDAEKNNTDPVATYHEDPYMWTDSGGIPHTESNVVVGQISGWAQNITFLYQPKSPTVTFHPNYDSSNADSWEGLNSVTPQKKRVTYGTSYGALATASREGYELAGWSLSPTGSEEDLITKDTIVKEYDNHTLYAVWKPKSGYGVKYDLNNGRLTIEGTKYTSIPDKTNIKWSDKNLLSGTPGLPGNNYTDQVLPVWGKPTRDYYFFIGWYVSLNGTGSDVNNSHVYGDLATNDRNDFIQLRAQWSRNGTFAVKYELNGGEGTVLPKIDLSGDDTGLIPATDPERPGYKFQGWKLIKRGTVTVTGDQPIMVTSQMTYDQISPNEPDDRTVTLEAQWTPKKYTVNYDLDGGKINGKTDAASKSALYTDSNLIKDMTPTRPGENGESWVFDGWELSKRENTDVEGGLSVTAADSYGDLAESDNVNAITLKAKWSKAVRYMVSYDLNGGSVDDSTTLPDKSVTFDENNLLPVNGENELITPTKTGYDFVGWRQLKKDGSLGNDLVTQVYEYNWLTTDQYVTLQAQWTAQTGFKVIYDKNNDSDKDFDIESRLVSWETKDLLPTNVQMNQIIIPDNKHLAGWEIVQISEQDIAKPYEVFNTANYGSLVNSQEDKSITLRAKWEANAVYTVQYDSNGGSPANITSKTLNTTAGTILPATQTPTRTGYELSGWKVTENGKDETRIVENEDTFADVVAESKFQPYHTIKLQAQWTPKANFTVKYVESDIANDPVKDLTDKTDVNWSGESLLPTTAPTLSHYSLVGWKLIAAGNDTEDKSLPSIYPAGNYAFITEGHSYSALAEYIYTTYPDLLKVDQMDSISSLTLKPVWAEESIYNVNYDLDGGKYKGSSAYQSSSVYWSDEVLPKDGNEDVIPVKPGYTFEGWKVTANANAESANLEKVTSQTYGELVENPSYTFIRLKAQWKAKVYTVKYDLNFDVSGSVTDPQSYDSRTDIVYNQTNLYPVSPNKNPSSVGSGVAFAGWYTSKTGGTRVEPTTTYNEIVSDDNVSNVTLYAQWESSRLTITFDKNNSDKGSTEASPQSITVNMDEPYGGELNGSDYASPLPTGENAPKRAGYTFNGWTTSSEGGVNIYDDTIVETPGDHTLYARWTPGNGYTVKYNYQDEAGNEATNKVASKSALSWNATGLLPTEPTRTGWTFEGWWTTSKGGLQVNNNTQYATLAVDAEGNPDDTLKTSNIYAHWTLKKAYKVKYDINGADHIDSDPVSDGTSIGALSVTNWMQTGLIPDKALSRFGYNFAGWKHTYRETTSVSNGAIITDSNKDEVSYGNLAVNDDVSNVTLEAQWTATNDNRLSFNNNHAKANSTPASITGLTFNKTLTEQSISLPATGTGAPTLSGYKFIGWDEQPNYFTEGVGTVTSNGGINLVTPDFTVNNKVDWSPTKTVYAVWQATNSNKLTFNKNHNDGQDGSITSISGIIYDQTLSAQGISLPTANSGAPTLTGYTFIGWDTEANYLKEGVGTVETDGGTGLVSPDFTANNTVNWSPSKTVYAVWQATNSNKLSFNKNHEDGTDGSITSMSGLTYDKSLTAQGISLPAVNSGAPTLDGYTFIGWDTKANYFKDGVGTVETSGGNDQVTPDFTDNSAVSWVGSKTVYAVWQAKKYTINYLAGAASEGSIKNNGYWYTGAKRQKDFDSITGWQDESEILSLKTGTTTSAIDSVDEGATWETTNLIPPQKLYIDNIGTDAYHFAGWVLVDSSTYEPIEDVDIVVPDTPFKDLAVAAGGDGITEITLMATWTKSYAVFYDLDGGEYTGVGYPLSADYYTQEDDSVTFRQAPEKTGYIFDGWKLSMYGAESVSNGAIYDANDSEEYENLAAIPSSSSIAENVTLKAKWTATSNKLNLDPNEGTAGDITSISGLIYDKTITEQGISLPEESPYIPTLTGYTFVGWDSSANFFESGIGTVTEDNGTDLVSPDFSDTNTVNWVGTKTVYAVWKIKGGYSVEYNLNGGSASENIPTKTGIKWTDSNLTPTDITLTKNGYTFAGWKLSKKGDNVISPSGIAASDTVSTTTTYGELAGNDTNKTITLQAQWTENSNHKVYYDTNGGTPAVITAKDNVKWTDDGLTPAGITTRNGYDFAGWKLSKRDNVEISASDIASSSAVAKNTTYGSLAVNDTVKSVTLQAQWTLKGDFTVQYDTNGGNPKTITSKGGIKWTDGGLTPSATVVKKGYTFAGWKLSKKGDNVISPSAIASSDTVTATTTYGGLAGNDTNKTITLQAQWTENSNHKVYYDTNSGTPASITEKSSVKWADDSLTPSATLTRNGYDFAGWKLSKRGNVEISSSDIASSSAVAKNTTYGSLAVNDTVKSITLQAQWSVKGGYSVNYDLNGGSGDTLASKGSIKWTDDNLIPTSTAFTKDGYTFGGWKISKLGNDEISESNISDSAIVESSDTYSSLAQNDTVKSITMQIYWAECNVKINYRCSEGGYVSCTSENIKACSGTAQGSVATPHQGYSFVRWEDSNGRTVCSDYSLCPKKVNGINVENTYTAIFEKKTGINGSYKVLHYLVDGNKTTLHETETLNGIIESKVKADPKTGYDGYTYSSGYTGEIKEGAVTENNDLVLKLYYTKNKYDVTYKVEGIDDDIPTESKTPDGVLADYNSKVSIPDSLTANGYIFIGWRSSDVKVDDDGTFIMPDHDVELVGIWAKGTGFSYKVEHYLVDANDKSSLNETEILLGLQNTTVEAIAKTGYKGYTYDASNTDTVKSGPLVEDDRLTLKMYYKVNKHNIKYDFSCANPGITIPQTRSVPYGTEQNVESALSLNGYIFSGWHTKDTRVTDWTFTMPDKDVTFVGSWAAFNRLLTVKFVDYDDTLLKSEQVSYGKDATAPVCPARPGHKFKDWDQTYTNVTEHKTVKAVYDKESKSKSKSPSEQSTRGEESSSKGQSAGTSDDKNFTSGLFLFISFILIILILSARLRRRAKRN